jgi:hypothetical protein
VPSVPFIMQDSLYGADLSGIGRDDTDVITVEILFSSQLANKFPEEHRLCLPGY